MLNDIFCFAWRWPLKEYLLNLRRKRQANLLLVVFAVWNLDSSSCLHSRGVRVWIACSGQAAATRAAKEHIVGSYCTAAALNNIVATKAKADPGQFLLESDLPLIPVT